MRTVGQTQARPEAPLRVAVVAGDAATRQSLIDRLRASSDLAVVAWADSLEPLLVLGTRADVCLCADAPPEDDAARLARRGCAVAIQKGDPASTVFAAATRRDSGGATTVRRPRLAPRQRDVLVAYVSSSDLLSTVARRLGMDPETVKTHLRRIRIKYAAAGRPAPTRRDLYVRAVEDGLLPPPTGTP
jgi:DNA-binding CsgD family transcriptional regulator